VDNDKDRCPVLVREAPDETEDGDLVADIERARGFVKKVDQRFLGERPGNENFLAFAAAQLVKPFLCKRENGKGLHGRTDNGKIFFRERPGDVGPAPDSHGVKDRDRGKLPEILGDVAHPFCHLVLRQGEEIGAVHPDSPGCGFDDPGKGLDKRALPAAIGPDNAKDFPGNCGHVKGFQHRGFPVCYRKVMDLKFHFWHLR